MARPTQYAPKGQPLSDADQWYGRQLCMRLGAVDAAQAVGVSISTFARAIIGAPVYASTAEAFRIARLAD